MPHLSQDTLVDGRTDRIPTPDEVSRRLARFKVTREPSALWPGLTERDRVVAAREIERVTRAVLAGERGVAINPVTVPHDEYALHVAAHTTGMGPLLGRWLLDGVVVATPSLHRRLQTHLEFSRARTTRIASEVAPALDALTAAVPAVVMLRGYHTARAYFDEPGVRRMADVDVLVAPEYIGAAESALCGAGFHADREALRPYKREWLAAGVERKIYSVELEDPRNSWSLELHTSFDRIFHPGAVARFDSERGCVELMELDGRALSVVREPLLALSLACHCSQELGVSRLLRLYELVQVIRTDRAAGRLDWDHLLSMMARTHTAHYAWPAFALAENLAPGTVDSRVLAIGRAASTWAARRTVPRLVPAGGSLDESGALRQAMWTRTPLSVVQRALRNFWPASFTKPRDVIPGWRVRLRRMRAGLLKLDAPDERLLGLLLMVMISASCGNGMDASTPAVVSVSIAPAGPLVRALDVTLERAAPLTVEYWTGGFPHLQVTSAASAAHELVLTRLRAGQTYQYLVLGTTRTGSFTADTLPTDLQQLQFGVTGTSTTPLILLHLYQQPGFKGFAILDSTGAVVWYWRGVGYPYGMSRRSNGNFVFMDDVRGVVEVSPAGVAVHELAQDNVNRQMHHDVIATPDNTLLFIAFDSRMYRGTPLKGESIWEWTPETGDAVKRFSSWDFFSPDTDRGPRFGAEWMHSNALFYGPRSNVLLGAHYWDQVISIAAGWKSIEWRLGGLNATIPVANGEQFSGQHTPQEIAPGHILMFDNALEKGGPSRAAEFQIANGVATKTWDWHSTPVNFASAIGSARRLANGHTVVCYGMSAGLAGSSGPTEVYEIDASSTVVWHLVVTGTQSMFRADPLQNVGSEIER